MSDVLMVLKEYFEGLRLDKNNLTLESLNELKYELKEAGEYGLAKLVNDLKDPNELLDYLGDEDENVSN